jgi:hypothetical protein
MKFFSDDSDLPSRHLRSQVRRRLQRTGCVVLVHEHFNQLYLPCARKIFIIEQLVELHLAADCVRLGQLAFNITESSEKRSPFPARLAE